MSCPMDKFQIGICLVNSQVKRNGKESFQVSDFSEFFFSFPNTIVMSRFSLPCAPFPVSIESESYWIWTVFSEVQIQSIGIKFRNFNSIQESEFNSIQKFQFNANSIYFNLQATSFNIFIQIKLSFHKINSFFSLVDCHLCCIILLCKCG
jgi:hypothetical protein